MCFALTNTSPQILEDRGPTIVEGLKVSGEIRVDWGVCGKYSM